MKNLKKCISLLLSLSLLLSILSTEVIAAQPSSTFSGKIELDSNKNSIDLSTIIINIYQSIPKEETATEWVTEFDEIFAFSISPNQDGTFEFTPPSPVFSLTIQVDTLPVGYGIDKHTLLYYGANNNLNEFTLSPISDATLNISSLSEYPEVVFLNDVGEQIYASYDYSPIYTQDVHNSNKVEVSGTVKVAGGIKFYPSATVDLSNVTPFDKINQLYNCGLITETEYLEESIQAIGADDTPNFCGVIEDIDLSTNSLANIPQEVQNSINDLTSEVQNNFFKVHYNSKNTTKANADAVAKFLLDMRSNSIRVGFKAPKSHTGDNQVHVYLFSGNCTDPKFGSGTRGVTYPTGSGSSLITVWKFSTLDSQEKETVAHEYFHTVQYAYQTGATPKWFVEAAAVWFAARYSGSIKRAQSHFNNYFMNCRESIFTPDLQYGAGVFPMAIDVAYGGPTTIRNIYSRMGSVKPSDEKNLESCITYGIQQYDRSGSFTEAFKKLGAYITLPGYFYRQVVPSGSSWTNKYPTKVTPSTTSTSKSTGLKSYGLQPYLFTATGKDATFLSIVVAFNSSQKGNASVRVVTKTSSNTIAPYGGDVPNNRYSTLIKPFANYPAQGSNNIVEAYVTPMYTGQNMCPVTISCSLSTVITG